jgi:hypothetical protein
MVCTHQGNPKIIQIPVQTMGNMLLLLQHLLPFLHFGVHYNVAWLYRFYIHFGGYYTEGSAAVFLVFFFAALSVVAAVVYQFGFAIATGQ